MSATARAVLLGELRRITGRTVARPEATLPSGLAPLDEALGGGWPRGQLVELLGRRSAGRTALALAALGVATRREEAAALVDVDGALDPRRALAAGVLLDRLLWVHAGDGRKGLQATELLLRAGGFALVVLDLGEEPERAPDHAWLRLGREAAKAESALLVVAPRRAAGAFAAITVETSGRGPRFTGSRSAPLLRGLRGEAVVVRSKRGAPGGTATVELTLR